MVMQVLVQIPQFLEQEYQLLPQEVEVEVVVVLIKMVKMEVLVVVLVYLQVQ